MARHTRAHGPTINESSRSGAGQRPSIVSPDGAAVRLAGEVSQARADWMRCGRVRLVVNGLRAGGTPRMFGTRRRGCRGRGKLAGGRTEPADEPNPRTNRTRGRT